MKEFLGAVTVVLGIFTSFAVHANLPAIGDFVVYNGETQGTQFVRMLKIEHIDSVMDFYTIASYSVRDDGTKRLLGRKQTLGPHLRKKYLSEVSNDCIVLGGVVEEIQVPAGKFITCRTEEVVSDLFQVTRWLGVGIPFGVVREITVKTNDPSDHLVIELLRFGHE
jgi:hypothetical protein